MNMKKIILIMFLLSIFYNVFALSPGESYFYAEEWKGVPGGQIGGEIRILLTIRKIFNDKIEITIEKDMTPFSQKLNFTVEANYEIDKYVFSCFDNWENKVFGYFTIDESDDNKLILFLDVEEFSEYGKNLHRLFGDTSILSKGTILFS